MAGDAERSKALKMMGSKQEVRQLLDLLPCRLLLPDSFVFIARNDQIDNSN